jgi:hypothetical protein
MPRSLSIAATNRLGDRLRKASEPTEDDLRLLQQLRADHDAPMSTVQDSLAALGLESTSRLKTTGTIFDKLIREQTRLSRMQDIAGVRVVREMRLDEQDAMVEAIRRVYLDAHIADRRLNPSHGYRAVHVIPVVDGCPVEIQIRTLYQDAWAQMVELAEGELGRGIRYGQPLAHPRRRIGGKRENPTQAAFVRMLGGLSAGIAGIENFRVAVVLGEPIMQNPAIQDALDAAENLLRSLADTILAARRQRAEE